MEFTRPEAINTTKSATHHHQHVLKRVIEELVRGREWASKLQLGMTLISTSSSSSSNATTLFVAPAPNYSNNNTTTISDSAVHVDLLHHHHHQYQLDDLVSKIVGSFTHTLSLLNPVGEAADEVSDHQVPRVREMNSPCFEGPKPPSQRDSSDQSSCKPSRRGCYKRRRTSEAWSRESPTLVDDGHAWRKYGQKVILNAEYPRNYFRCTHKFDQGCQATKQVQKIQEDPPVFRTTYHGRHTCKNLLLLQYQVAPDDHQIIHLDATRDSSILLNFESSAQVPSIILRSKKSSGLLPVPAASMKQLEMEEEEVIHSSSSSRTSPWFENQPSASSSSSDHQFMSHEDFSTFETSDPAGPLTAALSSGGSDHDYRDVISSGVYSSSTTNATSTSTTITTHTHSLGMDHMDMVVNDFDDFSQFEFDT